MFNMFNKKIECSQIFTFLDFHMQIGTQKKSFSQILHPPKKTASLKFYIEMLILTVFFLQ